MNKIIIGYLMIIQLIIAVVPMTSGDIDSENADIEVFIQLKNLPETLIFYQDHVPDYYPEYVWSIYFDVDDDVNTGSEYELYKGMEVCVQIGNWKFPGTSPHEKTILDGCQEATWIVDERTGNWGFGHNLSKYTTIDFDNDIITFICPTSWDELKDVDISDRFFIRTSYYSLDGSVSDNMTGYGFLNDSEGDIPYDFVDIIKGGFQVESPSIPSIDGPVKGKPEWNYPYTFKSIDPAGLEVFYYIDWGDDTFEDWIGPYSSDEDVTIEHNWATDNTYIIQVKTKNTYDVESEFGTLEISIPKSKTTQFNIFELLWQLLITRFQFLSEILDL